VAAHSEIIMPLAFTPEDHDCPLHDRKGDSIVVKHSDLWVGLRDQVVGFPEQGLQVTV